MENIKVSCNAAYFCCVYRSFAFCFYTWGRVRFWYCFLCIFCFLFLVLDIAGEVVLTLSCSRVVFVLWHLTSLPIRFVAATLCCFFCVTGRVCRKLVMESLLLVVGSVYCGSICEIPSWCSCPYLCSLHKLRPFALPKASCAWFVCSLCSA